MHDVLLVSQKQQLDALFARAEALYRAIGGTPFPYVLEVQADFARYLCIRVCGFVDSSVNHLLQTYLQRHTPPKLQRFAEVSFFRQQNLKANKLVELLRMFDLSWGGDLESFFTEQRRAAIDSLVDNRNQIAHGRSIGITHSRIREYYPPVIDLIEFLETRCRR